MRKLYLKINTDMNIKRSIYCVFKYNLFYSVLNFRENQIIKTVFLEKQ